MFIGKEHLEFLKFLLDKCGNEIQSLNLPLEWYEQKLHVLANPPPQKFIDSENDEAQYWLQINRKELCLHSSKARRPLKTIRILYIIAWVPIDLQNKFKIVKQQKQASPATKGTALIVERKICHFS